MASARAVQAVRSHVPRIKFPGRGATDAVAAVTSLLTPQPKQTHAAASSTPSRPSSSKAIGSTPRGSGIEFTQLPSKYQRLPLSEEEMEYIERGGPE